MRYLNRGLLMASVLTIFMVLGCGQRAQSSSEAIELSKAKATVEEQAKYLVQQANSFISSDKFDEAIATAKYVLSNLDANSAEAKSIIEKAQADCRIYRG